MAPTSIRWTAHPATANGLLAAYHRPPSPMRRMYSISPCLGIGRPPSSRSAGPAHVAGAEGGDLLAALAFGGVGVEVDRPVQHRLEHLAGAAAQLDVAPLQRLQERGHRLGPPLQQLEGGGGVALAPQ